MGIVKNVLKWLLTLVGMVLAFGPFVLGLALIAYSIYSGDWSAFTQDPRKTEYARSFYESGQPHSINGYTVAPQ